MTVREDSPPNNGLYDPQQDLTPFGDDVRDADGLGFDNRLTYPSYSGRVPADALQVRDPGEIIQDPQRRVHPVPCRPHEPLSGSLTNGTAAPFDQAFGAGDNDWDDVPEGRW